MAVIKAWSFSALRSYEECAYRFRLKSEGAPRPPYEENAGTVIHNEAEAFVKGEGPLTPALKRFEEEFQLEQELYAKGELSVEDEWGFDAEWRIASWNDAWLRMKLDQFHHVPGEDHALIVDHKSGKSWGKELEHAQQGQIYTIAAFMRYPELQTVTAAFRYLKEGKQPSKTYFRDAKFDRLFMRWSDRAERMLTDTDLTPRPNKSHCRFCDYGPNEGGSNACDWGVPT
jgi:CRISPR/Cas system-associated exonuclease Cas4 (RecB family)